MCPIKVDRATLYARHDCAKEKSLHSGTQAPGRRWWTGKNLPDPAPALGALSKPTCWPDVDSMSAEA